MAIVKVNLQNCENRLQFCRESFFPMFFRQHLRLICIGFLPLEKTPGGFQFQSKFRIRFPKPPWNLLYVRGMMNLASNFKVSDQSPANPKALMSFLTRKKEDIVVLPLYDLNFYPGERKASRCTNLHYVRLWAVLTCKCQCQIIQFSVLRFIFHTRLQILYQTQIMTINIREAMSIHECIKTNIGEKYGHMLLNRYYVVITKAIKESGLGFRSMKSSMDTLSPLCFRRRTKFDKEVYSMNTTVGTTSTVKLLVIISKKVTETSYFRKTLVRRFWYYSVYFSELCLDTSGLKLRFCKQNVQPHEAAYKS